MLHKCIALLSLAALCIAPMAASADYIRDQVRVNMRTGPSSEHRILRVLVSGNKIARLGKKDGWVLVRTPEGEEGWVPTAYVTREVPASVSLPKTQTELEEARLQIEKLSNQLTHQASEVEELAQLRARNLLLEDENHTLVRSDNWKKWFTGAAIAALFLAIGAMWPRGSAAQRTRRIKL